MQNFFNVCQVYCLFIVNYTLHQTLCISCSYCIDTRHSICTCTYIILIRTLYIFYIVQIVKPFLSQYVIITIIKYLELNFIKKKKTTTIRTLLLSAYNNVVCFYENERRTNDTTTLTYTCLLKHEIRVKNGEAHKRLSRIIFQFEEMTVQRYKTQ